MTNWWTRCTGPPRTAEGAGEDESGGWRLNLAWFRRFLLLHMAVRTYLTMPTEGEASFEVLLRGTMILVAAVGLAPGLTYRATCVAAVLVAVDVVYQLPMTANHVFLEFVLLGFLTLLREDDEREGPLLLSSLRWFIAIFFFYTGLQKVLYGYYFRGEFLAYLAGTEQRFAVFFQHFMPAEDLQRLASYNERALSEQRALPRIGAGPYRVDSWLFLAISNSVYVFEMAAGALLLSPRFRAVAVWAAAVFVVFIEAGARELTFGVLMLNLLALFLPGAWCRRLFPVAAAFYAYLLLHHWGVVPFIHYSPA